MEILEHVASHSRLAARARILAKITGRLELLNIRTIVSHLQRQRGEWVSLVHDACYRYCDSRFIFFTPAFFPLLLARKEEIFGFPECFEAAASRAVDTARRSGIRYIPPCHTWRIHGVSGGMGTSYDTTFRQWLKTDLRHQAKRPLFLLGLLPRVKDDSTT